MSGTRQRCVLALIAITTVAGWTPSRAQKPSPVPKPAVQVPSSSTDKPPPANLTRDLEAERKKIVDENTTVLVARRKQIIEEAYGGDAPDWAGTYYYGDGFDTNVSLSVSPTHGVTYESSGKDGFYDLNFGEVVEAKSDRVVVRFRFDTAVNRTRFELGRELPTLSTELLFVTWGDHRYLIPSTQMVAFCNAVNSGSIRYNAFPRRVLDPTTYAGAHSDVTAKAPASRPTVPAEFAGYVLEAPITAHVRSIDGETERVDSPASHWKEVRATVDAGAKRGLLRGMGLWIQDRANPWMGEVIETRDDHSTVVFRAPARGARGAPLEMPEVGASVSTRR